VVSPQGGSLLGLQRHQQSMSILNRYQEHKKSLCHDTVSHGWGGHECVSCGQKKRSNRSPKGRLSSESGFLWRKSRGSRLRWLKGHGLWLCAAKLTSRARFSLKKCPIPSPTVGRKPIPEPPKKNQNTGQTYWGERGELLAKEGGGFKASRISETRFSRRPTPIRT